MEQDLRIQELEKELEEARRTIDKLEGNSPNSFVNANHLSDFEGENLKESVIDNTHYPLLILDANLSILFANKKFYKSFSLTQNEIIDRHIYEVANGQWNIPQLKNVLETILPSKSSMTNFEMQYEHADFGIRYLILNATEISLKGSDRDYILLSIEDISKRKKAEKELEESEQRFHAMFHSSSSLLAIFTGPDHVIQVANDAIKKVWGKGEDVMGKPLGEVLPELKSQGIIELLDNVYQTGKAFHADELPIELIIDGKPEMHYFDLTYQPQRNAAGEIIGVADIAHDVTKQALLNKKIKKNEKEFRELVNFMPHKISMADGEGNPIFYNQSWLDYVGLTSDAFREEPYIERIHPDDREKVAKEVERSLSRGLNMDVEARIKDKDGNFKWHLAKATPVKDQEGNITSWITSSTEIQKLKEEEKRKEDFLKLVSHELKTPVTSIKGYIQLLLAMLSDESRKAKQALPVKPYLNRMETQVEKLIRLLSELLDLSRIEQNELELKIEKFNLNKHVEEIIEDLTYTNKDIQIQLEHQTNCEVYADRDRIGQVIINFVTNALKYSPDSNKVHISICDYDGKQVAVRIKDFGIGIQKNELNNIFKRFYRVSGNKDDTYAGFGIGLYLSNEIIQRHKGNIFVESEPGSGSEFTFTIPLNQK